MKGSDGPVRILMLEDSPVDALLIQAELRHANLTCLIEHVSSQVPYEQALRNFSPDLILSDFSLPDCNGLQALKMARESCPDVPFILVSGVASEEIAVESLHAGAFNCVNKERLGRLAPAVERALKDAEELRRCKAAEAALRAAYSELEMRLKEQEGELEAARARLREHALLLQENNTRYGALLERVRKRSLKQAAQFSDDRNSYVVALEQNQRPVSVLVIGDDRADAYHLRQLLEKLPIQTAVDHVEDLHGAVARADCGIYDVVLLDLDLPGSIGLNTFERFHEKFPGLPVIVLTGLSDDSLAVAAINRGAQDCLEKGTLGSDLLKRTIRYAIERNRLIMELRNASLVDALTGLYNRRGFDLLAGRQLKAAARSGQCYHLISLDMDGMKAVNDTLGHPEGDRALTDLAALMRVSCRETDITARLSGDEFGMLISCDDGNCGNLVWQRLRGHIDDHNRKSGRAYRLSVSAGVTEYNPREPVTLHELLCRAEVMMYEEKARRKKAV